MLNLFSENRSTGWWLVEEWMWRMVGEASLSSLGAETGAERRVATSGGTADAQPTSPSEASS